jgi:hypothetical protein
LVSVIFWDELESGLSMALQDVGLAAALAALFGILIAVVIERIKRRKSVQPPDRAGISSREVTFSVKVKKEVSSL